MASMKRRLLAATAAVWVCALGSAAALAYVLDRPLQVPSPPALAASFPPARPSADRLMEKAKIEARVLEIPTITIVAQRPSPRTKAVSKPVHDISQMNCSQWRDLQMGSGRVQVCE